MTPANWYWLFWFLCFAIPETIAVLTGHRERTLSYSVWQLRDLCQPLFYFIWMSFIWWLTFHFFTGKTKDKDDDSN